MPMPQLADRKLLQPECRVDCPDGVSPVLRVDYEGYVLLRGPLGYHPHVDAFRRHRPEYPGRDAMDSPHPRTDDRYDTHVLFRPDVLEAAAAQERNLESVDCRPNGY